MTDESQTIRKGGKEGPQKDLGRGGGEKCIYRLDCSGFTGIYRYQSAHFKYV
jgi:hypothetical protein